MNVYDDALAPLGVEGLVIKAAGDPYRPGARGWQKVKHYATTEFVIGGVTGDLARPQELILGRYASASGEFRVAGRTTTLQPSRRRPTRGRLDAGGGRAPVA